MIPVYQTALERDVLKASRPGNVKWAKQVNLMLPMQVRIAYLELNSKKNRRSNT